MVKNKIAEYRTLPSDEKGLVERKEDICLECRTIIDKAKLEKRDLSDDEKVKFNKLIKESDDIENALRTIGVHRYEKVSLDKSEIRTMKDVILPNERIEKRQYEDKSNNLDFGKLVRGMAGRGWAGAQGEQACYRAMQSAENSIVIPNSISDKIVDIARTKSALFGVTPVIQMEFNNLTVAAQIQDAVASFVNEGELIPPSQAIFEAVNLVGKTLAIFIPISEQLLSSASNLSEQLMNSSAMAIALAFDKSMLYGKGVVEGSPTEIKGISEYTTINKVTHTSSELSYDLLTKGIKGCKESNVEPTNIVYSTDMGMDFAVLKDSTGQYIQKPSILDKYTIGESNNVKINESYVFDRNSLLLGIQKGITMEWGTSGDMFQRIQKGLRLYIRADLGILNPKGITQSIFTVAP